MTCFNDMFSMLNSPKAGSAMVMHVTRMIATRKSCIWQAEGFPGT